MAISTNTQRLCVAFVALVAALAMTQSSPAHAATTTTTTTWAFNVQTYERTTSKLVVVRYSTKRLSTKGRRCYAVGAGTRYPWFWNSYKHATTGRAVWFKDRRRSTLCKSGGSLKRTACVNPSRLPRSPKPKGLIVKKKSLKIFKSIKEVHKAFSGSGSSTTTTTTGEKPVCRYLASPEHVFPGMSRWIDLVCTNTYQVAVRNDVEWRGFVIFHELRSGGVFRFKYVAPKPWSGHHDSGTFTPIASNGDRGDPVFVTVPTPPDQF